MADNPQQDSNVQIRFPQTLSIADIIKIVSVAITLTIAWSVFGTRITVVENSITNQKEKVEKIEEIVDKHADSIEELKYKTQENSIRLDNLIKNNLRK